MILCSSCGKQNIDRAKYCGYCGSALVHEDLPPAPQEWRSDDTVKASPIFVQEFEKKNRPQKHLWWRWLVLLLGLIGVIFAGWLLFNSNQGKPQGTSQTFANINPFQGTPTPTSTATSTQMPTPTPTSTSTPTITPTPTATLPPVGIGIPRQDLASIYINLGYSFQAVDAVLNQPRWIGRSIDNTCSLEIVGEPKEIIRATLILGQNHVGDQDMVNISYMNRFLEKLVPDWKESETWLQAGLRKLTTSTENRPQVSATAGSKIILLSARKDLGLTMLSIQGAPAAP